MRYPRSVCPLLKFSRASPRRVLCTGFKAGGGEQVFPFHQCVKAIYDTTSPFPRQEKFWRRALFFKVVYFETDLSTQRLSQIALIGSAIMDSLYLRFPDAFLPFFPFVLLPFTLCPDSGASAIIHGKLPKKDREKFQFFGRRLCLYTSNRDLLRPSFLQRPCILPVP